MIASLIGYILSGVASIVVMVLVYIYIVPSKRNKKLKNKFLKFLHQLFNFKEFYIEKILKYTYIWCTIVCICGGFFMFFLSWTSSTRYRDPEWLGYWWAIIMVAGPIALRIIYEYSLMFPIAIRNLVEINQKLEEQEIPKEEEEEVQEAEICPVQTKLVVSCTHCQGKMQVDRKFAGTKIRCPHCQGVVVANPDKQ